MTPDQIDNLRNRFHNLAKHYCDLANEARENGIEVRLTFFTTPDGIVETCTPQISIVVES